MAHDETVHHVCLAAIRRKSIDIGEWKYTLVEAIHPELENLVQLDDGELPIVSAFISADSWYIITSRRIIRRLNGEIAEVPVSRNCNANFGMFKNPADIGVSESTKRIFGMGATKVCHLIVEDGSEFQFEYETGKAAMAPIYALRSWPR